MNTKDMTAQAETLIAITRAVMAGQSNEEIIAGFEYSLNIEVPAESRQWLSARADEVRAIFNR